jgi:antitoxin component of RelBE/YafQ-DinJ toxin-antitoxin module
MAKTKDIVKPLRIDGTLDSEIKRVAKAIGLPDSTTMRKALERGLPVIEEIFKSPLAKPERKAA